MFFGSQNEQYYVGVDFGTRSVKAVEIRVKKDKPELVNYGWVTLDQVASHPIDVAAVAAGATTDTPDYAELLRRALKLLLEGVDPKAKNVNVAIPAFNGLVMTVDFPLMSDEELAQAIQYEARKYIPTSLEDVNISWDRARVDKEAKKMQVILVAAPKSEVQYYDNLFEGTNVKVDALELETFALVRSLVGADKGRYLLLDIGSKTTNLVYVEDGLVQLNRNIDVGGTDLTSTIAENLNISVKRAQEMKEGGKNFFSGPMPLVFPSLDYIVGEVNRVLGSQKSDAIDAIILSGGSARFGGLVDYISKATNLKVTIGNPLSRVVIDPKVAQYVEKKTGSGLSVAIGLALRAAENTDKK